MKLHLVKDQEKGFISGISFKITAKVILNKEEEELFNKYKAHKTVIGKINEKEIIAGKLIDGITYSAKDVTVLLELEDALKIGCELLYKLIETMEGFGGTEVIEFPIIHEDED